MSHFRFSRPQSGNSDLVSCGAVSEDHPAKHLFGLSRASVQSQPGNPEPHGAFQRRDRTPRRGPETHAVNPEAIHSNRSEERRVGKECRSRWWTDHAKQQVTEEDCDWETS